MMWWCTSWWKKLIQTTAVEHELMMIISFFQIRSTMKEEIGAAESRSERFVTHVDLTQTGTLLVSISLMSQESYQVTSQVEVNWSEVKVWQILYFSHKSFVAFIRLLDMNCAAIIKISKSL